MLSLASPLWLVGLLALPFIRWLHRSGPHLRTVPVSSLALWKRAAASREARGEARPPDPAWRRRALLAALLLFALSGPRIPEERTRVIVWVDDSSSMLLRERSATRLEAGLSQVRSALEAARPSQVEVRTLSEPWRNLGAFTQATIAAVVEGAGARSPVAPPAALVRRDSLHWLLSDGAEPALFEWTGTAGPDRIFQVSALARNAGLERLSARRNLSDPDRIDLLLKVTNGGDAPETRTVAFVTELGEVERSEAVIAPGASVYVNAKVRESAWVRAALQPADALPGDDTIELKLDALRRRRVTADPRCPAPLVAAIRAHPMLRIVAPQSGGVDARVDCGMRVDAPAVATLRVIADRVPEPAGGLRWSSSAPASARIGLEEALPGIAGRVVPREGDSVLLAALDDSLIVLRAGEPRIVETALDFGAAKGAWGREVPLLANFLFEQLLGVRLLDATAAVDRGPMAVNVVAVARAPRAVADRVTPTDPRARDAVLPVLIVALVVLVWELLALFHQARGLRDRPFPGSA